MNVQREEAMLQRMTILTVILVTFQTTWMSVAAESRRCFTAEIAATVVLPDDSRHAPGILRICTERAFSPVSTLHRTYAGGMPVGMYLSVPRVVEKVAAPGTVQFVFERRAEDELVLLGYTVGARDKTTYHEMSPRTAGKTEEIACLETGDRNAVIR